MPNLTPDQWTEHAANAATRVMPGGTCGSGACVAVADIPGGVALTSTLGADKGRVEYTSDEFAQFIADVHSGRYARYEAVTV